MYLKLHGMNFASFEGNIWVEKRYAHEFSSFAAVLSHPIGSTTFDSYLQGFGFGLMICYQVAKKIRIQVTG